MLYTLICMSLRTLSCTLLVRQIISVFNRTIVVLLTNTYTVHYTSHFVHCTVYNVQCTVYCVQCTLQYNLNIRGI